MSAICEQLEETFASRSTLRGGERYFDLKTSASLIEACSLCDVAILGIEVFELQGDHLIPRTDLIADYSKLDCSRWADFRDRSLEAARSFLAKLSDALVLLNFTLLSKDEWHGAS